MEMGAPLHVYLRMDGTAQEFPLHIVILFVGTEKLLVTRHAMMVLGMAMAVTMGAQDFTIDGIVLEEILPAQLFARRCAEMGI